MALQIALQRILAALAQRTHDWSTCHGNDTWSELHSRWGRDCFLILSTLAREAIKLAPRVTGPRALVSLGYYHTNE
jgi:hypothetical protein